MLPGLLKGRTRKLQLAISFGLVVCVSAICYIFSDYIGYRVVALILLVTVSFVAMFFDIWPVLTAALLSAIIWNFFFIPPKFTYTIHSTEDALMFLMYFIIATVNAMLTYKFRQMEKISQSKEEKERTLRLYNTLLNSLSHELRTPISTIVCATDNLLSNADRLSQENKSELLSEISAASFRLNQQVDNLLNMSRLESGFIQTRKDWTDISELIYEVIDRLEHKKLSQEVLVEIQQGIPLAKLDKGMIAQVLHNLVHNAVLYTFADSKIIISAMVYSGVLTLIIEDNGPGFPEDEMSNVFEKFYRLKYAKAGGTGLGLSIVKGFIEAHDGKIRLENCLSGGARFTIEIPLETSSLNCLRNE